MKFRMLILAVAVMAFSSLSFGQGQWIFYWGDYEGGSTGWFPMLYDCSTGQTTNNPVLHDGTVVKIMRDGTSMDGWGTGTDAPYVWGASGVARQIDNVTSDPTLYGQPVEFVFNSLQCPPGTSEGSFISPQFFFRGAVPTAQRMYLAIGCWNETHTAFTCMYYSQQHFTVQPGPNEFIMNSTYFDENLEEDLDTWVCRNACVPPITETCEDTMTPSPLMMNNTIGGHGDIDDPNQYWCVYLCEGFPLLLNFGPASWDEDPIVNVLPGCISNGCNEQCDPATFLYDPAGWVFTEDPLLPITDGRHAGYWTNVITVLTDGCACVVLEDILPVEMGEIAITPRDAKVEVTWTTLAESGLDMFKVMRNGEIRATINATAEEGLGANYIYVDEARNGVTYSYSLVAVEANGTETVLREAEATPNANLAVITEYALHQNYPNPFNPTTSIVFDVVEDNHVTLTVYNAMGQEVATLVNGMYGNGRHNVEFSSDNLTSGLYFYTVKIGNEFNATKKMLLVK